MQAIYFVDFGAKLGASVLLAIRESVQHNQTAGH